MIMWDFILNKNAFLKLKGARQAPPKTPPQVQTPPKFISTLESEEHFFQLLLVEM